MNITLFTAALQDFLNKRKQELGYTYFDHYEVFATEGPKYFKVYQREVAGDMPVRDGSKVHSSIHSFVDKTTGDIFKPASFNAPAKHARGNVNSEQHGMEAISEQGCVKYLRN